MRRQLSQRVLNPTSEFEIRPEEIGLQPETVWIPSHGAAIHTWLFHTESPSGVVLICSGVAGNKALFLPLVPALLEHGYEVVLYDYRGFGLSTGTADLYANVDDTVRVLDAVRARQPELRLALFGISLGAAVATVAADRRPGVVDGLILESLFDPRERCRDVIGKLAGSLMCHYLVPPRLAVKRQLSRVSAPLLQIHGEKDEITPLAPAARLFANATHQPARHEFWLAQDAGHSPDLLGGYDTVYLQRILEFLETYVAKRARAKPAPQWRLLSPREAAADNHRPDTTHRRIAVQFDVASIRHDEDTPVEISVVSASGKANIHRLWLRSDSEGRIELPVEAVPLVVGASAVPFPVQRDGDRWIPSELLTSRQLALYRQRLREILGSQRSALVTQRYGQPRQRPDGRWEWTPFDPGNGEQRKQKSEQLHHLALEIRTASDASRSRADQGWATALLAELGAALELFGFPEEAHSVYLAAIQRLPDHPETIVLFGNGSWQTGLEETTDFVLRRLIALASEPGDRTKWVMQLGELSYAVDARRDTLRRWRAGEAESAPRVER
ncbi:MAG: alpha/beta fold hydrolase [Acidobacteriota bacterium]